MQKFAIAIIASLMTCNTFAADIATAMKDEVTFQTTSSSSHIIYGGKDFTQKEIADANESIWSGQPEFLV